MDFAFLIRLLNGLLMVGLPVGLGFFLTRRFRMGWRLWWIGAAGFVLSQVGHIPFNALATLLFQRGILPVPSVAFSPYFNAIFLGLSAGLWETFARWGIFRWWADDARSWRKGVLVGAGHGGIEAIILGGLVLFNFAYLAALRHITGPNALVPAAQFDLAKAQIDAFWAAPWYTTILGAVERAFAIPMHIALSVIVLQAFIRRRGYLWLALAVLWHAASDGVVAVYLARLWAAQPWGVYAVEGILALNALLAIAVIFLLRRPEPVEPPPAEPEPVLPLEVEHIKPRQITDEDLDSSRYA
jgi:uncharacterized membrane protein YhfC